MLVAKYVPGIKGNISHQVPADVSTIQAHANKVRPSGVEPESDKQLCTVFVTFLTKENKEITSSHVFTNINPQLYPQTRKTVYNTQKDIQLAAIPKEMSLSSPSTFTDDEFCYHNRFKSLETRYSPSRFYENQLVQEVSLSYSAPYTSVAKPHEPLAVHISPHLIDQSLRVENGNVHCSISDYDPRFIESERKGESVKRFLSSGKIETEFPVHYYCCSHEIPYFSAQFAIQSNRTTPTPTPTITPVVDSRSTTVRLPSALSHDTILSESTTLEELTTIRTVNSTTTKNIQDMPSVNSLAQQFEVNAKKENKSSKSNSPKEFNNHNNARQSSSRVVVINRSNQCSNNSNNNYGNSHSAMYIPAGVLTTTVVDIEPAGFGKKSFIEEYRIEEDYRTVRTFCENQACNDTKSPYEQQNTAEQVYVGTKSKSRSNSKEVNKKEKTTKEDVSHFSPTVQNVIEKFETKIEESLRPIVGKDNVPNCVSRIHMNASYGALKREEVAIVHRELEERRETRDGSSTEKPISEKQENEEPTETTHVEIEVVEKLGEAKIKSEYETATDQITIVTPPQGVIQIYEEELFTSLRRRTPEPFPDKIVDDKYEREIDTLKTTREEDLMKRDVEEKLVNTLPLPDSIYLYKPDLKPPPPTPVSPTPTTEVSRVLEETITTIAERSIIPDNQIAKTEKENSKIVQIFKGELEPEEKDEKNKKASEEKKRQLEVEINRLEHESRDTESSERIHREWNQEYRFSTYEEFSTSRTQREKSLPPRNNRSTVQHYGAYGETRAYSEGRALHSGTTLHSGALSAGGICTVQLRDAREREKREIGLLNDRLADYIEKVRFLEAQNRVLSHDIELIRKGCGNGDRISFLFKSEIETIKSRIGSVSSDHGHIEKDIVNLTSQIEDIKVKWRNAITAIRAHREDHDIDLDKLAKLEAEISLFKRKIRIVEEDVIRVRRENDGIHSNISRFRNLLVSEASIKNEHGLRVQDLLHRIKVLQSENATRIDSEFSLIHRDTTNDNREYFRRELQSAINEIRSRYEEISLRNRNELEYWYREQIRIIHEQSGKHIIDDKVWRDELLSIRQTVTSVKSRVAEVESRNLLLQKTISDLTMQQKEDARLYEESLGERDAVIAELRQKCVEMSIELEKLCDHQISLNAEIDRYRSLLGGANITTYVSNQRSARTYVSEVTSRTNSDSLSTIRNMPSSLIGHGLSIGGHIGGASASISVGGNIASHEYSASTTVGGNIETRKPDRIHDDQGEDEEGRKFRSWYKGTIRVKRITRDYIELENICIIRRVDITGFRIEHRSNGALVGETVINRAVILDPKQTLRVYRKGYDDLSHEFIMDVESFDTSSESKTSIFNPNEPAEERGWFKYSN